MQAASEVFVTIGTVVIVAASISALVARDSFGRLHLATPVTSLGGPLIAVGLSIRNGFGLTTASVLLPAVLLVVSGPVLTASIGRMAGQRQGVLPPESPE